MSPHSSGGHRHDDRRPVPDAVPAETPAIGDPTIVWSPTRLRPPLGRAPAADPRQEPVARSSAELASARARAAARWHNDPDGQAMMTVEYAYTRGELQPVLQAVRDTLGCGALALDSPARLQDALGTLIASVGGCGDATVRRSPAALLTPEYWQIRLDGTDDHTLAILADVVGRRAVR